MQALDSEIKSMLNDTEFLKMMREMTQCIHAPRSTANELEPFVPPDHTNKMNGRNIAVLVVTGLFGLGLIVCNQRLNRDACGKGFYCSRNLKPCTSTLLYPIHTSFAIIISTL